MLSQRALEGLRRYVYKPGGYTWLDHAHQPFWNWLTEQLPMWLAPNLITLVGLLVTFGAYFVMWYYLPEFTGEAPRWTYFFAGLAILIYTNLDCIDGKQARRTKSSSPLGQLFDHGCDAISLHVMLALVQGAVSEPSAMFSSIACMSVDLPWLISHWEEYHTGVLMYGDGFFGIMEANYTLAAANFVTGLFGPGLWETPMQRLIPAWPWPDMSVKHVFVMFAMGVALVQFVGQIRRVAAFKPEALPDEDRGNKDLGTWARTKHLVYALVLMGLGAVYLANDQLQPGEARLASLLHGLVYATVATQLIMDHMCKEPFTPPRFPMVLLAAATANSVLELYDTRVVAAVSTAAMLVYYGLYVTAIVRQVTVFLGIKCFVIPEIKQA